MFAEALPEIETLKTRTVDARMLDDDSLSEQTRYYSEPKCLLAESLRRADGVGPIVDLGQQKGKLLVVTLGINAVVERTGLTVSVWGSPDCENWGDKPLVTLRQRQYCGVYSALMNLSQRPEVNFLRVEWNMSRWGKGERIAQFGFQVFLEESGARISGSACA